MRRALYIGGLVLSLCAIVAISIGWAFSVGEIKVLKLEKGQLIKDNEALSQKVSDLTFIAFPKTFDSEKSLQRWLLATEDKQKSSYYSEASVDLLNEAKRDGYWLGLIPVKLKYDYKGDPAYIEVPVDGGGYIMNVAVVDGDQIYLVDPVNKFAMRCTSMQYELEWK